METLARDLVYVLVVASGGLDGEPEFLVEGAADEAPDAGCFPTSDCDEFCQRRAFGTLEESDHGVLGRLAIDVRDQRNRSRTSNGGVNSRIFRPADFARG